MILRELSSEELKEFISKQMDNFFPDKYKFCGNDVDSAFNLALERAEHCFKHINLKRYYDGKDAVFNYLYSDQYLMFLYFLSNSLYNISQNTVLCDKLFFLNKALNGICIMYDLEMPKVFCIFHGMGSVIGKAVYGEYFFAYHNVTIGAQLGKYPVIGKGVCVFSGGSVIGNCTVGNFTAVGANAILYDRNLEDNKILVVDKTSGLLIEKNAKEPTAQRFFNVDITK